VKNKLSCHLMTGHVSYILELLQLKLRSTPSSVNPPSEFEVFHPKVL